MRIINVGTLFSGIGSPEEALKEMNVKADILFACDNDNEALKTYKANHNANIFFPDVLYINKDDISVDLDFLIFGPPCQSFSFAGCKKGFSDDRGKLFLWAIEILGIAKPKYFIAENVVGLLDYNFDNIKKLVSKYYNFDVKIYNSLEFGLPHHRKRVYIIGQRSDIKYQPIHLSKSSYKPLAHFLDKNVDERFFATKKFLKKDKVKKRLNSYSKDYINCITNTIARNGTSSEYINYVSAVNYAIGQCRKPTPRECARVQGFPDNFIIPDISITSQYRLFANAMSVPILKELFSSIGGEDGFN